MLNNNKYFNQLLINSENVKTRISELTKDIELNQIIELINKTIEEEYINRVTFSNVKSLLDCEIFFCRAFIKNNSYDNELYSMIRIYKEDSTIIITGLKNKLILDKKDLKQDITITFVLDEKTGIINITLEQKIKSTEYLDEKMMQQLKEQNTQTKTRTLKP